ncbi:MAG TPA: Rdx family protein [Candidatus Angelobacter sp.]|nr:Rdx family protein [Candidatus Angelobacter sp.]
MKQQAGSLKEEIDRKFNLTSKIRMGGPGVLDVIVDGRTVFSAKAAKRMPTAAEVLGAIAGLQS